MSEKKVPTLPEIRDDDTWLYKIKGGTYCFREAKMKERERAIVESNGVSLREDMVLLSIIVKRVNPTTGKLEDIPLGEILEKGERFYRAFMNQYGMGIVALEMKNKDFLEESNEAPATKTSSTSPQP